MGSGCKVRGAVMEYCWVENERKGNLIFPAIFFSIDKGIYIIGERRIRLKIFIALRIHEKREGRSQNIFVSSKTRPRTC